MNRILMKSYRHMWNLMDNNKEIHPKGHNDHGYDYDRNHFSLRKKFVKKIKKEAELPSKVMCRKRRAT